MRLDQDLFFKSIPSDLAEPIRKEIQEWQTLGGRTYFTDKMLCIEITLGGQVCRVVRFRNDQVSIVREKEITAWANDSSLRAKYLNALEAAPVVANLARSSKMWIKYASLSPADLEVLLRAARELVQQIGLEA